MLSAVATDHQVHEGFDGEHLHDEHEHELDHDDDPTLVLTLAPPPPLAGGADRPIARRPRHRDRLCRWDYRREEKRRLREQNVEIVVLLVRKTGQTHAQINSELNRLSGVGRITEATVAQLLVAPRGGREARPHLIGGQPQSPLGSGPGTYPSVLRSVEVVVVFAGPLLLVFGAVAEVVVVGVATLSGVVRTPRRSGPVTTVMAVRLRSRISSAGASRNDATTVASAWAPAG